jgi:hypothetical protein
MASATSDGTIDDRWSVISRLSTRTINSMADDPAITPQTVKQVAAEMLALPLAESDLDMVAGLLNSLRNDLRAMRRMNVGTAEPATLYMPREGGE